MIITLGGIDGRRSGTGPAQDKSKRVSFSGNVFVCSWRCVDVSGEKLLKDMRFDEVVYSERKGVVELLTGRRISEVLAID